MSARQARVPILVLLFLVFSWTFAEAQRTVQRLILKDGSFQLTTQYEIRGDRVRYMSAERSEWEEMPASLVDWDATKKWQEAQSHPAPSTVQSAEELKQIEEEDKAARAAQEAKTPLIAPGLWLPETGGVFLLDVYRDKPEVAELKPNEGNVDSQKGKNLVRAAINPVASAKESIELPDAHAKVQAHIPDPAIFVNLRDEQSSVAAGQEGAPHANPADVSRMRIVRVQVTPKGKRVVGMVKINLMGKVSEKEDVVETQAEPYHGSAWMRITPKQHLDPGQYALVEMVDPKRINIAAVYDFSVNPGAPDNVAPGQAQADDKPQDSAATKPPQKKKKTKQATSN